MYNLLKLSDFIEINPRMKLEKGKEYQFVDMGIVEPGNRYVKAKIEKEFNGGGAKFQSGDTLFARITPCLENGKIAQFKAPERSIAFGSTEFFVFRNIHELSDPGFVYYLAKSDLLRKPAEKSMAGASGRQRADIKSITNLEIPSPPLFIQHRIASILSAYDDLIENNTRRIQIFEEMAQRIYMEWFVHFRFPGHENVKMVDSELGLIPNDWEIGKLEDALILQRGYDLPKKKRIAGNVPIYAASGVNGMHIEAKVHGPGVVTGRSGSLGKVMYVDEDFWPLNTTLWVKEFKKSTHLYAYYLLGGLDLIQYNSGAAVPTLNRNDIHGLPVVLPSTSILNKFDAYLSPFMLTMKSLRLKNDNLRQTRDLLLPKLISGDIDVSEIPYSEEIAAA